VKVTARSNRVSSERHAVGARSTYFRDRTSECSFLSGVGDKAALGRAALVAEELGVSTAGVDVALLLNALDSVSVLLTGLVVSGVVL